MKTSNRRFGILTFAGLFCISVFTIVVAATTNREAAATVKPTDSSRQRADGEDEERERREVRERDELERAELEALQRREWEELEKDERHRRERRELEERERDEHAERERRHQAGREHDHRDEEREHHETELRRRQIELELRHQQVRLELAEAELRATRLGRLSEPTVAAVEAIDMASHLLDKAEAVDFLTSMLVKSREPIVKRALRQRLAELSTQLGRRDEALHHLQSLILVEGN